MTVLLVSGFILGRVASGELPSVITYKGFLRFVNQQEIAKIASSSGTAELLARYPETGDRLDTLAEQLQQPSGDDPGRKCLSAAAGPQELSVRDLVSRAAQSPASLIGSVVEFEQGWSTYYQRPAALVRLAVETLVHDVRSYLRGATEVLAIVPIPYIEVDGLRLCADQGPWPSLEQGGRFLLDGFWIETDPPILGAIELIPIRDGMFVNPGFRCVDLPEPSSEEAFVAGFRARGWIRE